MPINTETEGCEATHLHLQGRIEESHKINHSRQMAFLLNSNQELRSKNVYATKSPTRIFLAE